MSLCERLKQIRLDHNLSQGDVSLYLGFKSRNGYWSIENGVVQAKFHHIEELCKLYSISPDYFSK